MRIDSLRHTDCAREHVFFFSSTAISSLSLNLCGFASDRDDAKDRCDHNVGPVSNRYKANAFAR